MYILKLICMIQDASICYTVYTMHVHSSTPHQAVSELPQSMQNISCIQGYMTCMNVRKNRNACKTRTSWYLARHT